MPDADLTQPIRSGMPTYPGDPSVSITDHATHGDDGYRVSELACGTHTGTHVDAPSHTEADGRSIDEFPVERFVLDAVLVDCRGLAPRTGIGPDALPATDADAVVVDTGWDDHWGDSDAVDHPYLTPTAARFCRQQGYDLAVDTLSPDPTPSERADPAEPDGVPVHHTLLGNGHLIVENLTNLAGLPERFELRVTPLPLADADGSPVRAVARYD